MSTAGVAPACTPLAVLELQLKTMQETNQTAAGAAQDAAEPASSASADASFWGAAAAGLRDLLLLPLCDLVAAMLRLS